MVKQSKKTNGSIRNKWSKSISKWSYKLQCFLDGWWAEGYTQNNGWTIGTNAEYESYEAQDQADSQSMYRTLEEKIIPTYYDKDRNGMSKKMG